MPDPVFSDNFESGNLAAWDTVNGAVISTGINGAYCVDIAESVGNTSTDSYIQEGITGIATIYAGLRINANAIYSNNGSIITFFNGATVLGILAAINVGAPGTQFQLNIWSGDFADFLGEYVVDLDQGTLYEILVKYTPHASNGVFQVKLDGSLVIDVSGVATSPSTANVDVFSIGDEIGDGYGFSFLADDIIVNADDWVVLPAIAAGGVPIAPPPIRQPFYEPYGQEHILSRPWHTWFVVMAAGVAGQGPPPVQQPVLLTPEIISKPWRIWFQQLGTLQSISEAPFHDPLLNQGFVSESWGSWFYLAASA